MLFCDRIEIPDDANAVGINILLGAAEGDIVADPEVQRAKREEAIKTKVNFKTHQIKTFIHKDDLVS